MKSYETNISEYNWRTLDAKTVLRRWQSLTSHKFFIFTPPMPGFDLPPTTAHPLSGIPAGPEKRTVRAENVQNGNVISNENFAVSGTINIGCFRAVDGFYFSLVIFIRVSYNFIALFIFRTICRLLFCYLLSVYSVFKMKLN